MPPVSDAWIARILTRIGPGRRPCATRPFVLILSVLPARADLLYFQKGGEVQASASVDGDRVFIELPDGNYEFHRGRFPEAACPVSCQPGSGTIGCGQAQSAGFSGRFEAVWWAIENGLVDEAAAVLRELSQREPEPRTDRPDGRGPRPPRAALHRSRADRIPQALGIPTTIARGPHIVLLHEPVAKTTRTRPRSVWRCWRS